MRQFFSGWYSYYSEMCLPIRVFYKINLIVLILILHLLNFAQHFLIGAADTINLLRSKYGIKIGSSTGYTKEIMAVLKVVVLNK